jgi:hypothetical protein
MRWQTAAAFATFAALVLTAIFLPGNTAHADDFDVPGCGHPTRDHDGFSWPRPGVVHTHPSISDGVPAQGVAIATNGPVIAVCVGLTDGRAVFVHRDGVYLDGCITVSTVFWDQVLLNRLPECPAFSYITVFFVDHRHRHGDFDDHF